MGQFPLPNAHFFDRKIEGILQPQMIRDAVYPMRKGVENGFRANTPGRRQCAVVRAAGSQEIFISKSRAVAANGGNVVTIEGKMNTGSKRWEEIHDVGD